MQNQQQTQIEQQNNVPDIKDVPVLLLAAGLGTRAREVTQDNIPKQMIPLSNGQTVIEFGLSQLNAMGFRNFFFAIGHHGEMLRDHLIDVGEKLRDGSQDTNFNFYLNPNPLGPTGRIYSAIKHFDIKDGVVIMASDMLLPWNKFYDLLTAHTETQAVLTLALTSVTSPHMSDIRRIIVDKSSKRVAKILGKSDAAVGEDVSVAPMTSTGMYAVNGTKYSQHLELLMSQRGLTDIASVDFRNALLPHLMEHNGLYSFDIETPVLDMGTTDNINYGINNWGNYAIEQ
jgi:NDP-sugar pyrophosphorylase family protein